MRRLLTVLAVPILLLQAIALLTATLVNVFVTPGIYLNFGSIRTDTELDLTQFEEELLVTDPAPATPATTTHASAPLAGAGAES